MEKRISPELRNFAGKVLLFIIVLILIAYVGSLFSRTDFGEILFLVGLLSSVIGTYIGKPGRHDFMSPRIRNINFQQQPSTEELFSRKMYEVKNSAPRYSVENALALAGLIAALISLFILFGNPA